MFFKLSVVVTSVLIGLAAGVPTNPPPPPPGAQCCSSTQQSSQFISTVPILGPLLAIVLGGLNVPIGLGCSPITVIGNNCGGTTVNCDSTQNVGGTLIAINCLPIVL
ncbi:fungal hydrophobin [Mycena vulgaris]|nr:fungal hydrophobin [Mycena vulgaris]